jgi:predicted RNA-binding protein with PIN domain
MAGPSYIIDGYNLLHKVPALAGLAGSDLERARELLLGRLVCWRGRRGIGVTVVFDGAGGGGRAGAGFPGVKVVFSRPPLNADEYIVRLAAASRTPGALTVVSSDNSLVSRVRECGAKSVSAGEFARLLVAPARSAPGHEKRDLSAAEVRDWEEYFRDARRAEQNLWTPPRPKRRKQT